MYRRDTSEKLGTARETIARLARGYEIDGRDLLGLGLDLDQLALIDECMHELEELEAAPYKLFERITRPGPACQAVEA